MIKQVRHIVLLLVVLMACPFAISQQNKNRNAKLDAISTMAQIPCDERIRQAVSQCEKRFSEGIKDLRNQLETANQEKRQLQELNEQLRAKNEALQKSVNLTPDNSGDIEKLKNQITVLNNQMEALRTENIKLKSERDELQKRFDNLPRPAATIGGATEEIKEQITELNLQIQGKNEEIAQLNANYQNSTAQCVKDPEKILAEIDNAKRGDTSDEYYTKYENGQKFQARDLLIGTLLFPDPSNLQFEAGKFAKIIVVFRPRVLGDNQTKWFVNFRFAKATVDFPFDASLSHGAAEREISDGGDHILVWKTEKLSPAGFKEDKPHIIVDAGYRRAGGEDKKVNIENKELVIRETIASPWYADAWDWFKTNLAAMLGLLSGILGLSTIYLGISKTRIEHRNSELAGRKAEIELAMAQEKARTAELEAENKELKTEQKKNGDDEKRSS